MKRAMTIQELQVEELCRKVEEEWRQEREAKLRAHAAGLGGGARKITLDEANAQVRPQAKVPPAKVQERRVVVGMEAKQLTRLGGRINRDSEVVRRFLLDGIDERILQGGSDREFNAALAEASERAVREFRSF